MADYTERANEEFVEAITRIKESKGADKEANEKVTELLLNGTAQFLMPVMITDEPAKERKILYGVIAGKDGQPFYMLFTSKQKIKEWNKEGRKIKTVTHTFEEAANKAVGDPRIFGFVINPMTDDFIIGRAVIQNLLTKLNGKAFGLEGEKVNEDEDVTFQDVREDEVTEELKSALTEFCEKNDDIMKVYLRDMIRNGHLDYVLVIYHTGSMDDVFPEIMEVCKAHSHGRRVALLSAKAPVASKATNGAEPFFMK